MRGPLILLKDGSLRSVVSVESINFDLKSNDEQTGIIRGFMDFLNALDFPLQIIINSRKLDLTSYLAMLKDVEAQITNELLKIQMAEYGRFIKGLADLANIMSKTFFIVIPYHAIEGVKEQGKGIGGKLKALFGSTKHEKALTDEDVQKYQSKIEQRIAVVMAGISPLGAKTKVLDQPELLNLLYAYYNPGQTLQI